MSEVFEQSIVALLEERVELAISTVQELRANKLELEAEIARLNNVVLQRDAQIQELENNNNGLRSELDSERSTTSEERSEIRERLAGLMDVLIASDENEAEQDDETTLSVQHHEHVHHESDVETSEDEDHEYSEAEDHEYSDSAEGV